MSKTVLRRPLAVVSLGYLCLLVLASALAPVLSPYDPNAVDLDHVLSGPAGLHPLGTDGLGRDVLARLLYGGRISLVDAAVAVLTVLLVGVPSGLAAGFFDGWLDRVFGWVVDVMLAIPILVTLLVVLAVVGDNRIVPMVALGVLVSPGLARVVRGATLVVRREPYIAAARVGGLGNRHILFRHILPRVAGPIIVQTSLLAGGALLIDAGLSYLGFGVQPPTPTWGNMINTAAGVIARQPWLLAPPGIVLGLATLAFGLLGDAVLDATAQRVGRVPAPVRRVRAPRTSAPPSPALLSLRQVSVALPGPLTVVQRVDLDVAAGETVGLVGESGCGKSVLGRAILGMVPAAGQVTEGRITFDGTDLTTVGTREVRAMRGSRIALVSQDPVASLDPLYSVGRQIGELVRRHHGGSAREVRARVLDLLRDVEFTDPEPLLRRYPHELSGGMAQRVAIAMALAGEPALLIADEPTTALDVTVQAEVLDLLRRLQAQRAMAILLISHDWGVVADLCQRAYVMYAGQIVESSGVGALFDRPLHPYTAGLLAAVPRRAEPGRPLPAIAGTVPQPEDWPSGCHFAARCPLVSRQCRAAPVPMAEPVPGRHTRCLRHALVGERRSA
jgi:peptide/nickel transport system permease protein